MKIFDFVRKQNNLICRVQLNSLAFLLFVSIYVYNFKNLSLSFSKKVHPSLLFIVVIRSSIQIHLKIQFTTDIQHLS